MKYKTSDVWLKLTLRVNQGFLNLLGLMPYLEGGYQICLFFIHTACNAIYICKAFQRDLHLYQKSLQTLMWHAFLHFHKVEMKVSLNLLPYFVFLLLCSLSYLQNKHTKDTHFSEWRPKMVTVLRCVVLVLTDSFVSSDSQGCYKSGSDDVNLLLVFQLMCHLEE